MLQNGFPVDAYGTILADGSGALPPACDIGGFEDRFIFTPPRLEVQHPGAQLNPSVRLVYLYPVAYYHIRHSII